jgi:hypothetical protein
VIWTIWVIVAAALAERVVADAFNYQTGKIGIDVTTSRARCRAATLIMEALRGAGGLLARHVLTTTGLGLASIHRAGSLSAAE